MKTISLVIALTFAFTIGHAINSVNAVPPLYVAKDVTIRVDNEDITLRAGTPVVAEAVQTYNSKNLSAGQSVSIRVKFNVVQKKKTLVAAGALGTATISDVQKPKGFGRPGRLELQIQSVQAVDGQQILLSGIPMVIEGENKKGLAWGIGIGAGVLTWGVGVLVGFAIKGKDAEFKAGTTLNASVASDMQIEIDN